MVVCFLPFSRLTKRTSIRARFIPERPDTAEKSFTLGEAAKRWYASRRFSCRREFISAWVRLGAGFFRRVLRKKFFAKGEGDYEIEDCVRHNIADGSVAVIIGGRASVLCGAAGRFRSDESLGQRTGPVWAAAAPDASESVPYNAWKRLVTTRQTRLENPTVEVTSFVNGPAQNVQIQGKVTGNLVATTSNNWSGVAITAQTAALRKTRASSTWKV